MPFIVNVILDIQGYIVRLTLTNVDPTHVNHPVLYNVWIKSMHSTVNVTQDTVESIVRPISMNVHPIHVNMVVPVQITLILIHVLVYRDILESAAKPI
jgi:hypothetical protein